FIHSMNVIIDTGPTPMAPTWYIDYSYIEMDPFFILDHSGRLRRPIPIYLLDPSQTQEPTILDSLITSVSITRRVISYQALELEPGATSTDLFVIQEPSSATHAWTGNPPVAQLYQASPTSGQVVFFSLPFQYCDGSGNLGSTLQYVLEDIFH
ncbi:MAG: hypothetical protein L3J79_10785, partial [Candidatus Marinimicrobia bacterium]|nr:hypothetical protein [Candidatus Neomarinimicrobiota bacterium]